MQKNLLYSVLFISFLILTGSSNFQSAVPKDSPCQYENMGGELPERMCQLREFLKALPPYDKDKQQDSISNALLFSGKPGTGKTMGAHQLAVESGAFIIPVMMSDIANNASAISTKIDSLYEEAKKQIDNRKRPIIILFDDAELSSEHNKAILILNTFIDKAYKNPYIMTVVTMNKDIRQLDPGFKDRSRLIQWPLPSYENRVAIITLFKKRYGCVIDQRGIDYLAQQTEGFSCRNLEKIFMDGQELAKEEDAVFFGKKHLELVIEEKREELEAKGIELPPILEKVPDSEPTTSEVVVGLGIIGTGVAGVGTAIYKIGQAMGWW